VIPFAALGLGVALYTLFHPGVRRGPVPVTLEEDRAEIDEPVDIPQRPSGDTEPDELAEVISIDEGDRQRAARPVANPERRPG
jgi:hypothetical protein